MISPSRSLPIPPPPSPASPEAAIRRVGYSYNSNQPTRLRDDYKTPPFHASRFFTTASNYSSDEASDDGDDVPPTPGDVHSLGSINLAASTGRDFEQGGIESTKLFANGAEMNSARLEDDGSLSLSPVANVFYPSFGDFLPSIKKQEEAFKTTGLGFDGWDDHCEDSTASDKIDSLSRALTRKLELAPDQEEEVVKIENARFKVGQVVSPAMGPGSSVFAPFATFSPNTDSFTFFPSPDWKADGRVHETKEATTTSASLLSPEPNTGCTTFPMQKSLSSPHRQPLGSYGVVVTPPSTPVRSATYRSAPFMQQSRSLPIPVSLSPSRSTFSAIPSSIQSLSSQSPSQRPAAYPLSPADTERIAKLHNGRIPTLEQLCPEPVHPSTQPPIVNTGNQGVMVVQQGDWKCGTCSFVNWRRRKICLRCFPFANDIGNILTIQSQRAAHLATPNSAPAHQTQFFLPSPTRSSFDLSPSASGMGRSTGGHPSFSSTSRPASLSPQAYLLVPPPPGPHSASPTRSTFALQPPPSPTRYTKPSPSSFMRNSPTGYFSEEAYSSPSTSPSSASASLSPLGAISAGDLALRRAAKIQSPSSSNVRKHPSIQPLNLSNYTQQLQYAQAQTSPYYAQSPPHTSTHGGGGGYEHHQLQHGASPISPTRTFHHHRQILGSNGIVGAEL